MNLYLCGRNTKKNDKMDHTKRKFTFVEYDEGFPALCKGNLKFKHQGILYVWSYCLISGGEVTFDDNDIEIIKKGSWKIDPPEGCEFTDSDIKLIEEMVNENVEQGCCGGCV